jgi:hypothetical protein
MRPSAVPLWGSPHKVLQLSRPYGMLLLVACLSYIGQAQATSNVQQTLVLTVVIVELIFAFGVGITCVIFSINLYRALLKEAEEEDSAPRDELPTNYVVRDTFANPHSGRRSAPNINHAYTPDTTSSTTISPATYNALQHEDLEGDIDDCASDDYELEHNARRKPNRGSSFRSALSSFTTYLRFW